MNIPINIMIALYIFITCYFVGLALSLFMLYKSFKEKKGLMIALSSIIIIFYVLFGCNLL